MTTMGRWFSRRWLFSLHGHAVNTSLCLSVSSLVRSFVRSLVGTIVRPFPLFLLCAALSFLVRSVQVGARRGIQAVIRFVRARTPAFPIDRSNGTLPHPRFSIARHRVLLSRVYAITRLLHLLLHLLPPRARLPFACVEPFSSSYFLSSYLASLIVAVFSFTLRCFPFSFFIRKRSNRIFLFSSKQISSICKILS